MNREWYKKGQELLDDIAQSSPAENEVHFWHLGQCGFVFKGESVVYIDTMLNDHVNAEGISSRYFEAPYTPAEVEADYVICTHDHLDHLAPETVQGIAAACKKTKFIIPGFSVSALKELGLEDSRIIPMRAGETLNLPGLTVTTVATAHPVYQKDADGYDFSLAFSLEMNGVRLLHLGDTYLTDQLLEDLKCLPTPDIFFPPINGGDYFRTARNCIGNLSGIESATLASILKPDLTVPTHFDMFKRNTVDPLEFIRLFVEMNPGARWHVPTLGERYIYRK